MTSALLKLIGLALLTLLLVRSLRTSGQKNTLATNAPPPPPERLRFAVRRRQQKRERRRQRKVSASLSSPPPPLPIIGHTREAPLSTAAAADVPPLLQQQQVATTTGALSCSPADGNPTTICNGNPCLLGLCLCVDGHGGETCERGVQRVRSCDQLEQDAYHIASSDPGLRFAAYDYCAFHFAAYGIVRVDEKRWREAQGVEAGVWAAVPRGTSTDRNEHHARLFSGYAALPAALGHVIELGCGPYTQLQTILQPSSSSQSQSPRTVLSITLVDPLAAHYKERVKGCTYRDGRLGSWPVRLVSEQAERFKVRSGAQHADTLVMIFLLQSVRDVPATLQAAYESLRPGGLLVFADRVFDSRWDDYSHERGKPFWDASHPCAVKQYIVDHFLAAFEEVYMQRHAAEGGGGGRGGGRGPGGPRDEQIYFIGRKPAA